MNSPRVIFAGTPDFALASLSALVSDGIVPVAVLTQPDRPAGRGKRMTASPVKRYAIEHGISVLQPATLRDEEVVAALAALDADVMIVAAYGLILPQNVLDIPRKGCLNVHASELPRWRGAAPIQAAILAGDETTGISLMAMTAGLDCGPVYVTESLTINAGETAGELHDRLAKLGGEMLVLNLADILANRIEPVEQDESQASYAGKIRKQDAELDWTLEATELERRVRAYNPVPGAFFFSAAADTVGAASSRDDSVAGRPSRDTLRIKCWRAHSIDNVEAEPGTVVACNNDGVIIACGVGALVLDELQLPGKRRVSAREFANQLDLSGRVLS